MGVLPSSDFYSVREAVPITTRRLDWVASKQLRDSVIFNSLYVSPLFVTPIPKKIREKRKSYFSEGGYSIIVLSINGP